MTRCHLGLQTVHEETHLQGCQCVLIPSSSPEYHSTCPRQEDNSHSGYGLCQQLPWLLQRHSLAERPKSSTLSLQWVQNAAAGLIGALGPRDTVVAWRTLEPVEHRIVYKLCSLMHLINIGRSSQYLSDLVTSTSDIRPYLLSVVSFVLRAVGATRYRRLVSRLVNGFFFTSSFAWNSLPQSLPDFRDP